MSHIPALEAAPLAFRTLTVRLPAIPAFYSDDITIAWPGPLPGDHYQIGLATDDGSSCVLKAHTRAAALVTVTAGPLGVRQGAPLTAAVLYY